MIEINWYEEAAKRTDSLLRDTQHFLKIKSVLDELTQAPGKPFGDGIDDALVYMLELGAADGFKTKNTDGYAGHIEMGSGDQLIGVLCHVDVVPEGDGWSLDPYGAQIKNGRIYARGAIDDKGPTMAAYYAMKIVKELNLPLRKRVRIILGTDEESSWQCVDYYFKNEEMPTMGFVPDADFPIIYAEKGIADFELSQKSGLSGETGITLEKLQAGRRYNMVPDFAEATLLLQDASLSISPAFKNFLQENRLNGKLIEKGTKVTLQLEGVSAHGSVPDKGKNAGVWLGKFLSTLSLDDQAKQFISFINQYFGEDTAGQKLTIDCKDEVTGELTLNLGIILYGREKGGKLGVNMRYPVKADIEKIMQTIQSLSEPHHITLTSFSDSKPHYIDKNHELIQTLQKVYEEQTGEEATLLSIGGGTYARALKAGVAFGPLFPGRDEVAHEKDEYIEIEDLIKATAIYAQAIYELAK